MNSCHKVVRSIRNTTLKLCAYYSTKQFISNVTELYKKLKRFATIEKIKEKLKQKLLAIPKSAKKIIFSDEAHFDIGGYVNKQNWSIWGTENPHAYIEKSTHPKRVTLWFGFWSTGITGPLFYENKQGEAVIVNGDRYRAKLDELLFPKIEEDDIGNI